jgi:hypothetical protein
MATTPDPIPDLCKELVSLGWECQARAGAQFTAFSDTIIKASDDIRRAYRLGFCIEVPLYQSGAILLKAAIERCGTSGIIIFDYKEARFKIAHDGRLAPLIVKDIVNLGNQVLPPFGDQLVERIRQAEEIHASLEECLVVNTQCKNWHYRDMRIDDILTAHRLTSPADRWPMYRRQANTPNTKMSLVDALSEHATTIEDISDRFELSTEAGDMLISRGDLEARPAWHYWE